MLPYPDIDPVAVSLGPVEVHWYGLMYLFGFLGAWWLGLRRARRTDLHWTRRQVEDLIFYGALGVVLGGRIGYTLFYNLPAFLENPLTIFYIHQGGMSFHGGMLGVFIAVGIFAKRNRMRFFQVTDMFAPMVPIGLGAGRIGNFINRELWGRPAESAIPWAMDYGDHVARHPSSLYQAITEGLLLFLILWWYSSKPRPYMAVSALFMLLYGAFRFTTEFYRTPDAHIGFLAFDWLTMGQLLSIPMILFGAVLYTIAMNRASAKGHESAPAE